MDWLLEPLSYSFIRTAFVAGMVIGAVCALVGVFVVQRGMSFLGDGLAHAAFGGIALGLYLGTFVENSTWSALPFTVLVALGVGWVLRRGNLRGDVATGVFFAFAFALGVLFMGMRPRTARPVSVETVLFGNILSILPGTLYTVIAVAIITAIVIMACWTRLAYATFNPELAALSGVRVAALEYMLLAITAVVIVVAVKAVGVVMVSSFIVIPAATARLIGRTLARVAALAVVIGVLGAGIGLLLSYHLNASSGATIILTLSFFFAVALIFRRR